MTRKIGIPAALLVLSACASPLERVTKLSEVDLPDTKATTALAVPETEPEARARMGWLVSRLVTPKSSAAEARAATDGAVAPAAAQPEAPPDATMPPATDPANAPKTAAEAGAGPDVSDSTAATSTPGRGLFGRARAQDAAPRRAGRLAASAPDMASDLASSMPLVSAGTRLPYGAVARVCDMPRATLGPEIARYPERRPLYRLHDSAPGGTGARSFHVTGFADGCARQFTGALAMFGAARMHEQLRYGAPARSIPYSATDLAYEKIKAQVCGVGRNTPCGARVTALEKDTVFVTVYESFGGSARWVNLLLHDRQMVASALSSR